MVKNGNTCVDIFIYCFIISISFININSIQYFKSFNLLSNDNLVLITDEGIKKYDPLTQNETLVQSNDIIQSQNDLKYVAFVQFPLGDGGYIICRLNNFIYLFDKTLDTYYQTFLISDIKNYYCILKPYKALNGDLRIIIASVDNQNKIQISMYKLDID